MNLLLVALLLTGIILFSFLAEQWLKPQAPKLLANQVLYKILLQSLSLLIAFLVLTLIVQRPVFSAIAIVVFIVILVVVSNAKFRTLREPIVFSDITMFSQAFKHPRLYFPFLGLAPIILGPIIILGLIYTVLVLEPALPFTWQRVSVTLVIILLLLLSVIKLAGQASLTLEPEIDNARLGLLNAMVCYAFQAHSSEHKTAIQTALKSTPFFIGSKDSELNVADKSELPDITVIQSESFFDARRLSTSIKRSVLENYDQCKSNGLLHGKLTVPAWGANTMRSEFTFLSAVPYESMGLFRYYPYQYLKNFELFTLATHLKNQGYYCVCIHPHAASFFGRDTLFPQMGFDEFIDIRQFDQNEKLGPYIADKAVTNKILELTSANNAIPMFIFVITMENHGPLHLEKVTKAEFTEYYDTPVSNKNLDDLTVYLRHLKNADKMIQTLTEHYSASRKKNLLCLYGDHVPSMPTIYDNFKYDDNRSDFIIWSTDQKHSSKQENLNIDSLAARLLQYI